jgi:predicted transcriptional regulator
MKTEPSIFDEPNDAAEADADARAEADIEAGRVVSHEAVSLWLSSWANGKPMAVPRPEAF